MTRAAINGFGRIGRLVARALAERSQEALQLVTINDLADARTAAWLLKHDSVHRTAGADIGSEGCYLTLNGARIQVTAEPDPLRLPYRALGVDLVFECTGAFNDREAARKHIEAGAKRVLIAGPASDADLTMVFGINQDQLKPDQEIVSAASCTTNCLAILVKVLNEAIGIERALTQTIHGYTADQPLLDQYQPGDVRRARAAGLSIIPVATSSPRAVGHLFPQFRGKIDGSALRVPTPNVSRIDLSFVAARETSVEEVNCCIFEAAADEQLGSVLEFTREPLVAVDLNHSAASAIVDAFETRVIGGTLVRVSAWYDNEWGYAQRLVDIATLMAIPNQSLAPAPSRARTGTGFPNRGPGGQSSNEMQSFQGDIGLRQARKKRAACR